MILDTTVLLTMWVAQEFWINWSDPVITEAWSFEHLRYNDPTVGSVYPFVSPLNSSWTPLKDKCVPEKAAVAVESECREQTRFPQSLGLLTN